MSDYLEVKLTIHQDYNDILVAELEAIGYDSFMDTPEGIHAYVEENLFSKEKLEHIIDRYKNAAEITYTVGELEKKNWNEEWEKNFQPVTVNNKCLIRATFHAPQPACPYEIIINPKMSFGTGHHETTHM